MRTRQIRVDRDSPEERLLEPAARALRAGALVAFPTETVYGLGADALNEPAVRRVFDVKGRPADNPLILHVSCREALLDVARADPLERWRLLSERFWPGPLTLVLGRLPCVPPIVSAGLDTVAVRMPAHPVALALIRLAGRPIAAPSANRSGRPSPCEARHVLEDLGGSIEWVIDAGPTEVGVESTVLDLTVNPPVVLRPGGISVEALREVLGDLRSTPAELPPGETPRSPGMKYRHYAPKSPVVVLEGPAEGVALAIERRLATAAGSTAGERATGSHAAGAGARGRVALLITEETRSALERRGVSVPAPGLPAIVAGSRRRPEEVARALFSALRELDRERPEVILAEAVEEAGIGVAVNHRLRRAAAGQVERCAAPRG